ncbi:MAG TPA: alpha-amylase family glycosyl hydrolase, partial [Gemmatimonadaceae bacterium]
MLRATYRVQLNAEFTLQEARSIVPYLDDLGVSHLYCSPVLAARHGSTHGYDVVDPTRVDPELGDERDLLALASDLHARGMGLVLDIVPNHMSASAENPYWDDVLRHGEGSRWAHWFDIDWAAAGAARHHVVLPVLGDEVDRVIDRGELIVRIDESGTRVSYFDKSFPVDPTTLPVELQLAQFDPAAIPEALKKFRGASGRPELRALLEAQHYRLVFWRRAHTELNYRRFFDVNDLIALRMEDPAVFEETHALILRWVREGVVDGLRVDHIDGLLQPRAYLERLRAATTAADGDREPPLLFVEKILSPGETLRDTWPVQGTTGYEFLNDVEDALISPEGFANVERCYRRMRRLGDSGFAEAAHAGKRAVLVDALRPDVDRLTMLAVPLLDGGEPPSRA